MLARERLVKVDKRSKWYLLQVKFEIELPRGVAGRGFTVFIHEGESQLYYS